MAATSVMSSSTAVAAVFLSSRVTEELTRLQLPSRHHQTCGLREGCGASSVSIYPATFTPAYGISFSRKWKKVTATTAKYGPGTEKAFKSTVELDQLIDTLRNTQYENLVQEVAENVLSFDTPFWLRLATRADMCSSLDDKKDYEELASQIMAIVELLVQKTKEKIESSTDVLKSIIAPLIDSDEEIVWPPRNPQAFADMRKEVDKREKGNYLDESFLSEVSAQLRQANEDADKPGLVAILQKVLQLYAAGVLSKRSYAAKGMTVDKAEELLETVISADEEDWDNVLRTGLDLGGGPVQSQELFKALQRRVERTLMRTENGSYQQRILVEYLRGIETRAQTLVEAFQASPPSPSA
ncbi:unnamed protein product [Sphagnum balticum]